MFMLCWGRMRGYTLMVLAAASGRLPRAGRDLALRSGNSRIHTCGASAVVMVHEQAELNGDSLVEGQLVAENASTCSEAVHGTGPSGLCTGLHKDAAHRVVWVPLEGPRARQVPETAGARQWHTGC